ncbi:hypothetical protein [Vibrio diabolicus]|uniref:hypothetical protein n=1 Tax=Vibrio diabolicus TaxID=50719 RepID=UPI00215F3AAB|nr:hypothetical protein [Vibrio diabolicus]MCS0306577.1 hypothetical protein [Vibrio diabolicus]
MRTIHNASLVVLSLILAACGGGEEQAPTESAPEQGVTLSLKDASLAYLPSVEGHEVNLSRYVTTSDNSPFKLTRVEALSSDAACQVLGQTDTQFYVAGDTKKACDYRYFAESVNGKLVGSKSLSNPSNSALVRLATTDKSAGAELPPLNSATLKNTPVSIDLKAQFDAIGLDVTEWELSAGVTLPYNHDAFVDVDVANQTLTYTPESDFSGIDRILFSFTDENKNPRMGHVDVAISVEANQGLEIQENIVYPEVVRSGMQVEIDISPYVTSPDGDDYQLVFLQAFDAKLSPVSPEDMYNKKFYFESGKEGDNIVSFAVSDHKGAYEVGLMKVEVYERKWEDFVLNDVLYMVPLTVDEAQEQGVEYSSSELEEQYYPPENFARLSAEEITKYCSDVGAEVITKQQWLDLTNIVDLVEDYYWPKDYSYGVNDTELGKMDVTWAFNSNYFEPMDYRHAYPLCIKRTNMSLVPDMSKLKAVANMRDKGMVAIKLSSFYGDVEGKVIKASLNLGSSAQLDSDTVTTDRNGIGVFKLGNLKAEVVILTAESSVGEVIADVQFVPDLDTAQLSLNTTLNEQDYSGSNEVTAVLSDAFDNPLIGYDVAFSADTHSSSVDVQSQGQTDVDGNLVAKVTWTDAVPYFDTTVSILAEFDESISPLEARSEVTFIADESVLGVCGGKVNDKDMSNAQGNCLKVAEANGKWFTSSPSLNVASTLGYGYNNSSSNSGKTYAATYQETGTSGPAGGVFLQFRQDGIGGTQHQRYCQHLADIGFAGRINWQRPSIYELADLVRLRGHMYSNFGWPTSEKYWSGTAYPAGYFGEHGLTGNFPGERIRIAPNYVSCVSNP